jgi:hypothetical protein
MALTTAYLITTKNLEDLLNAIKSAQAPERFSYRFLENLGFSSSNDRLYIPVLKGLGFLDENAAPTERYFEFLDQSQSGAVLAEALREAYGDLFAVNTKAYLMGADEVKNKLRTLTRGEKSDKVVTSMANTFCALSELADWEAPKPTSAVEEVQDEAVENEIPVTPQSSSMAQQSNPVAAPVQSAGMHLHYNIKIHLPETRDPAVFDAIFQSLRRHLM